MQGSSRIPQVEGVGQGQSFYSLGTSPYQQVDFQTEYINYDETHIIDINAELNLNVFQNIAICGNNLITESCPDTDFNDFFEELTGEIIVKDESLFDWCELLNDTSKDSSDIGFNFPSDSIDSSTIHHFNPSPVPQDILFNQSLYGGNYSTNDYTSEIDVVSVDSEPVHNLKHICQDRRFDFLSQTKIELNSSDETFSRKRKKAMNKYVSSDEDYDVEKDEEDDDDYEICKRGRKKACKHVRKRKSPYENHEYDCEWKKKSQNKRAAMKYRDKKKQQDVENENLLKRLSVKNAQLKRQKEEKEHELKVLKRLFEDLTRH